VDFEFFNSTVMIIFLITNINRDPCACFLLVYFVSYGLPAWTICFSFVSSSSLVLPHLFFANLLTQKQNNLFFFLTKNKLSFSFTFKTIKIINMEEVYYSIDFSVDMNYGINFFVLSKWSILLFKSVIIYVKRDVIC
jgi:hypothetical protein